MTEAMIISIITTYSLIYGVDPKVALSVAKVESGLNHKAISRDLKDHSVFQIRSSSFPSLTKKGLMNPYVNILIGIRYLKTVSENCKFKEDNTWVVCYNRGIKGRSRVIDVKKDKYYQRVMAEIRKTDPMSTGG